MVYGLEAQLMAFGCALAAGLDQGITEIQLECCHGLAISACQDAQLESESCRDDLVLEIKRLASVFCVCEFSLIPNGCNSLALELTAYACNISSLETWLGTIPPFLTNFV
jgi:hypothetical protein